MLHALRVLFALLTLSFAATPFARPEPFTAEAMWSLDRLGEPALSPDGRLAVVPVTRYDVAANTGFTDLWLIPTSGGPARQLTSDPAPDTQPAFSPDGKWIAFVSRRGEDKENQIYVIAVDGGEARRVTQVPTGADLPRWFPDGHRLAFVTPIWTDLVRWEDQAARLKERQESRMTARVWEKAPIAYWDHFLDDRERHLFAIDVNGGEPVAITRQSGYALSNADVDAFSYDISPDGTEVAFVANVDKSGIEANFDVIVLPSCGCKPARNITADNPADDGSPRYSPDGRWLAFSQQRIPRFYADRARLMVLDRKSGAVRKLTEDWDRSVSNAIWLPDSRGLIAAVDDAATYRLYRFDLSGGTPRAVTTSPSFSGLALGRHNTAVALRQSFTEPPTLVRVDVASGKATALSTFNDAKLARFAFGKVESVTYKGARNDDIQMFVVYPADFDPSKKYPVYMLLHGGPHNAMVDSVQWRWNAHVFANWGYIVTWHNFHGSSGFGQAFADSINPDWVTLPYEDTIKAAQWLMAQPFVDKDRMAAGGGSYGGFLAATLLGREHPFKTLVAHAAVYNEYTQIASDYGAEKPRFYHYWENPEEFARISPHTHAANFKTPTLIVHGQMDLRVPVNHGIELFNTLQSKGVRSKLVYFPDENHWVLKPQNSLFWYRTVREWIAQYVEPGAR
ncbi:MAG: S9 family peptidase [Steroidobacteraceae bacterium]|nr:S9 family peptidase [Steroidobacteraceae bacterium]